MSTPQTPVGWKAGVARRDITPRESIWLAGFGSRTEPSKGVRQPICATALALSDAGGPPCVMLCADLIGFNDEITHEVRRRVQQRYDLPADRLLLNASHSHSTPVVDRPPDPVYDLSGAQREVIQRHAAWVTDRFVEAIDEALARLEPVELAFGQGLAGLGVNRRRARPGCRHFAGLVDHDVPVLRARRPDGELLAVVFGYACHTTVSGSQLVHGDYAGFARAAIEAANPGASALFMAGCGADINALPRCRDDMPEVYGKVLALAVQEVLDGCMEPLGDGLTTTMGSLRLPLQAPPSRDQLEARRREATPLDRRCIDSLLAKLDRDGTLARWSNYEIQVWKLGNRLIWIFLQDEMVVDYALRFKGSYGWDSTWVSAYCNDCLAYVPSRRVLTEGDYEGGDAMLYFGLSAPFEPVVEELIAAEVDRQVASVAFYKNR